MRKDSRHNSGSRRSRFGKLLTTLLGTMLLGQAGAQVQNCADNLLWYNFSDAISTYNPATNVSTKITATPKNVGIGDITFGTDGKLYGIQFTNATSSPRLYNFDPATGVIGTSKPIYISPSSADHKWANALGTLTDGRLLFGFSGQPAFYSQYGGIYTQQTSQLYQLNPNTTGTSYSATVWVKLPRPPTGGPYVHTTGDIVQIGNYVYVTTMADNGYAYLYKIQIDASNNPVGTPQALRMVFPDGTGVPSEGVVGLSTLNGKLYAMMGLNEVKGIYDTNVYLVDQNTGRFSDAGDYVIPNVSGSGAGMTQRINATTCTSPTPTSTDLGITKKAGVTSAQSGDTVEYTLNVTNNGPSELTQAQASGTITITDTLPAGTTLASIPVKADNVLYSDFDCSASVIGSNVVKCTTKMGTWPVGYTNGIKYTVKIGATTTGTLTNTAQVNFSGDTNPANNTDQATITVTAPTTPPPAMCNNLYSMVVTGVSYDNYYGGRIQQLNELNNTLTGSSLSLPYGVTSATLAISPDGKKFYVGSDADGYGYRYLYTYDTTTGYWSRGAAFNGATSRLIRMAVTPSGVGYAMDIDGHLWSFNSSGGTTYLGVPTSTSPTAPDFYRNGDMYSTADGKLYLLSAQTGGYVTLWYLNPANLQAEFLGNLFATASDTRQYNGLAVTSNGTFASSSDGYMIKLNPLTMQYAPVSYYSDGYGSTDLASCYFPDQAPKVTTVKSVAKVGGSPGTEVQAGDTLEYTITVRNSGNLPAGGVTVRDALPAGTTYVPDSTTVNGFKTTVLNGNTINLGGPNYPLTNSVGVCSLSNTACTDQVLKPDSTPGTLDNEAVVKFRVTVNPGVSEVRNTAVVNYTDGHTPPVDIPSNPTVTPISTPPQLTIAKTSNAVNGTWNAGQTGATYTLTVRNAGATSTNGVITVKDLLPNGLTYNGAATAPAGWTCTVSGQMLTCTTSSVLAAGASVNITVPVNVVGTGTLVNKAVVGGGGDPDPIPDPAICTPGTTNPQNQCASVPVTISGQPLLGVIKSVAKVGGSTSTSIYPGDILEYTITVRNTGTVAATGVTFQDALPAGTTYVADSARINNAAMTSTNGATTTLAGATYPFASPVGICSYGMGITACTNQTLNVDTTPTKTDNEAVITFRVKVNDPFTLSPSQVSNQAFVTIPGKPPVPSDDPRTPEPGDPTVVPVVKPVKLVPVKTVQNITAGTAPTTTTQGKPGDVLEYCITTTNTGSANATRISFGDNVPANTTFQLGAYGAGRDILWKTSTGQTAYYSAAVDTDFGALVNDRVIVSDPSFVLQPTQSFTVCFRATIK